MKKMNYQAPALKVIEFKVERGFQASNSFTNNNVGQFEMEGNRNEGFTRTTYTENGFWGN